MTERKAGYYWVKMSDTDNDGWECAKFKQSKWVIFDGLTTYDDSFFTEINEDRIASPNEILQTEDSLLGLLQTVQRLAMCEIDFQYDAKKQNLTYKMPGQVRIIATTVNGGFNFGKE